MKTFKKVFFDICYYATLITILTMIASFIFLDSSFIKEYFNSGIGLSIRMILLPFLFILWIKCIIVWSKKDRNIGRFFLLFFLHGFYIMYYYPKIKENKWL